MQPALGSAPLLAEICRDVLEKHQLGGTADPNPLLNKLHPEDGSALHYAVSERFIEAALALAACSHFTMVNAKLKDGSTALHLAAANGLPAVVEAILSREDFYAAPDVDGDGFTALHAAAFRGELRCARMILLSPRFGESAGKAGSFFNVKRQPLSWAKEAGDLYDMSTALHMAAAMGHSDVCEAIMSLAPRGSSMANEPNRLHATALHMAARGGHLDVVRVLLAHREFTDVNAVDTRGFTALHWAAQEGHAEIFRAILARADFAAVDAKDLRGRTARELAAGSGIF